MTVFDLFSKRQKRLRGEVPDVYTYDSLPRTLRNQIVHIWNDSLGTEIEGGFKFQVQRSDDGVVVERLQAGWRIRDTCAAAC